jgi:murein DD-endopeptidase MepM/ murein hydrolase activator NlpD
VFITDTEAAGTTPEIEKLKGELAQLEKDKKDYEDKIKDIESSSASALQQKYTYEEQIAVMESKIISTESLIKEYNSLIAQNNTASEEKQAEYDEMYEKVKERLRIRYESGISNQLVYIMESGSFTEFLVNMERTADILRYDREIMAKLTEQKEGLATDRALLEQYKAEQEKAYKSLTAEKKDLDDKKKKLNNYITSLEKDQKKYEQMLIEAEKADEELNAKLEAALAALAKNEVVQHPVNKDSLIWPVSTKHKDISSPYGERTMWGRKGFHYGIDIPAPAGSNVYASQSGTVVISQSHYSYGNYVVINHGGGYTTLYAHNSKNLVTEGQVVERGDVIALVGTTGTSTGNHCHLEVRVNGAHKNPLNFVVQPE